MAEQKYSWPSRERPRSSVSLRFAWTDWSRRPETAKYTYDVNLKNQLIVRSAGLPPRALPSVKSIDTTQAQKVPGVVTVHVFPHADPADGNNKPIEWQGELIAAVAAETEAAAVEGVAALKVEYEKLDAFDARGRLAGRKSRQADWSRQHPRRNGE